ncbi:MAG TPA: acyl-CoA thioesterase II [Acidimicrobiales bacterium]|nr:acyl-CoA thioesterase II [Acidimicrobiales bacterium]
MTTGDALRGLLDLLDLEAIEVNIFRGRSPDDERQRVFGGQVAGQALVAAGRTVDHERRVHSLHAYFLRPGDPNIPILYEVDRIRDGTSFTTRRVVAVQHGKAIFHLSASFHRDERGFEHSATMPAVPGPEDLPTWQERMRSLEGQVPAWFARPRPIDTRFVREPWRAPGQGPREPHQQVWMRADGSLPDDPLLHACVVAYASDMTLLDSVVLPHRDAVMGDGLMMASLDHAMWFHRPFRADEWFLYDQESPSAASARGLAAGHIFRADGRIAVSVVQEGLVRALDARRA